MKVFNLVCPLQHVFEGWFASEADLADQQQRGLLTCPMCGAGDITKGLSAPRLNLKGHKNALPPEQAATGNPQEMARRWLEWSRQVVAHTDDVGAEFAEQARKMHRGEMDQRAIRGTLSGQDYESLSDEGVDVLPLWLPESAKQTLQ
ncbi:MAG: DUF1178 family protein [Comamonas sp.]